MGCAAQNSTTSDLESPLSPGPGWLYTRGRPSLGHNSGQWVGGAGGCPLGSWPPDAQRIFLIFLGNTWPASNDHLYATHKVSSPTTCSGNSPPPPCGLRVGHSDPIAPTPNGHLPALFGGPFHVQPGEWGFCPLDRAVGVNPNPESPLLRCGMRLALGGAFPTAHSTSNGKRKRPCMKRTIKKVVGVVYHPQGT
jgi:hypothetical protein